MTTWGFKKDAGYWDIDLGVPPVSISGLNNITLKMVDAFIIAFSSVFQPLELRYDLMTFNADGKLLLVSESEKFLIPSKKSDKLLHELAIVLSNTSSRFISSLFIDGDMLVQHPGGDAADWISNAGSFYLGYVMEQPGNDEDVLVPVDSGISFKTTIDVWVNETVSPGKTERQDNRLYSKLNQPVLENALRAWEELSGKEISEWGSRFYGAQAFRYGYV